MPKGLRILRLAFVDTHLTHFGGMILLQRFAASSSLMVDSEICQDPSAKYQLPFFRSNPCAPLCHKTEILQYNWGLPFLAGAFQIPRSIHPPTIPQEAFPQSHSRNRRITRPAPSPVICLAQTQNYSDFRFRFSSPHCLWKISIRQSRLQSQEARPEILPSASLLRSPLGLAKK